MDAPTVLRGRASCRHIAFPVWMDQQRGYTLDRPRNRNFILRRGPRSSNEFNPELSGSLVSDTGGNGPGWERHGAIALGRIIPDIWDEHLRQFGHCLGHFCPGICGGCLRVGPLHTDQIRPVVAKQK